MGGERVVIAGISTRALAESALRAGFEVASVDAFGDLDQQSRIHNVALVRELGQQWTANAAVLAARDLPGELVVYGANFENHPTAVRRLAEGRRLLGNSPAALTRARDWATLAKVVRRAGGRVPQTFRSASRLPRTKRFLRKPRRGGGGSGVRELRPGARLGPREVAQERLEGTLASMAFLANGRRALVLGFARGLAGDAAFGARGYRYCGSLYPLPLAGALARRLGRIAEAVTRSFGLVGLNGIDFVIRGSEAFVLELNPRYCASMDLIERGSGESLFAKHVAACQGSLPARAPRPPRRVLGKAVLWARADVMAPDTSAWLDRDDVRDVPHPGERIASGHPICTIFAEGRDQKACYRRLVSAARATFAELRATSADYLVAEEDLRR